MTIPIQILRFKEQSLEPSLACGTKCNFSSRLLLWYKEDRPRKSYVPVNTGPYFHPCPNKIRGVEGAHETSQLHRLSKPVEHTLCLLLRLVCVPDWPEPSTDPHELRPVLLPSPFPSQATTLKAICYYTVPGDPLDYQPTFSAQKQQNTKLNFTTENFVDERCLT